ncbi:hypothetical protein [Reichenbachiella sp.]
MKLRLKQDENLFARDIDNNKMEVVKDEKTGATLLKIQVAINADEVTGVDPIDSDINDDYKEVVLDDDFLGANGKRQGIVKLIKDTASSSTFKIALSLLVAMKQPPWGS